VEVLKETIMFEKDLSTSLPPQIPNPHKWRLPGDGFLWLLAGILALAGFVWMWRWSTNAYEQGDTVQVLVAAKDLAPPLVLSRIDTKTIMLPKRSIPQTAILAGPEEAAGLTLIHPVAAGQILTTNEFLSKPDAGLLGVSVPRGTVGILLPETWFAGPIPELEKGDKVTILVSGGGKENTGIMARSVPVLALHRDDAGIAWVMVSMEEKNAADVLQARAANAVLHIGVDGLGSSAPLIPQP
jgi:hypothetical protein